MRFTTTDDRARLAAHKGGEITASNRKGETITRLCLLFPGSQPAALRAAYEAGYASGAGAKYQEQKRLRRQEIA